MKEIKFYRGLKSNYSTDLHKDGVYFATDEREIIFNGQSYGTEVDDTLLSNSINPVEGRAIYKAIQDSITDAISSTMIGNKLVLAKQGNTYKVELYDSRTNTKLSETAAFVTSDSEADASGISIQWLSNTNLTVKPGQKAEIRFKYDLLNSSGNSTGIPGRATISVKKPEGSGASAEFTKDLVAGDISVVDVTEYLVEGNTINVIIKVDAEDPNKGPQSQQASFRVSLFNIKLTDDRFSIAKVVKVGESLNIPLTIEGNTVQKRVVGYLDGINQSNIFYDKMAITTVSDCVLDTSGLSHGSHTVQIRAEYKIDELTSIYSNTLYYNIMVVDDINTNPVIATRFNIESGNLVTGIPDITIEQYNSYSIQYSVHDPLNINAEVEFYSEGELVNFNTISQIADTYSHRYTSYGVKENEIRCRNTSFKYKVTVNQSSLNIEEPTGSQVLYLDAYGKTNTSPNKDEWTYNGITTDFEGFTFGGDGWINGALRLLGGCKATINYKPLSTESGSSDNSFAFSIKFKVTNATNDSEEIVKCVDSNGTGFIITTQEVRFVTRSGSKVSSKFASGETYNIGVVSYPTATQSSNTDLKVNTDIIYLYINGVMSGSVQRSSNDSIYQTDPQNIVLSSSGCTLDVYSIRVYNTHLTDEQMFSSYIIDLGTAEELEDAYNKNDILDSNGNISVSSVYGKIPYIIVTGQQPNGQSTLHYAAVVNNKKTKFDVDSIMYIDGSNPEFNFICVPNGEKKPKIQLQGTSSLAYPRKNYKLILKGANLYLGCDSSGNGGVLQSKPEYAMSKTAAPVHTFCIKADYAESSSSHNTGMTQMVQKVLATANDLTPAQKYVNKEEYNYEVRTTIEGHPALLFYRNTAEDTPIFAGKFNFNNDKSTEAVFGFLDIPGYHDQEWVTEKFEGKNPTECWEFLSNEYPMGRFKEADFDRIDETSQEPFWLKVWEARFPDDDDLNDQYASGSLKPKYLMRLVKWINSTDTEQATNSSLSQSVTYDKVYTNDTAEYRQAKFKYELKDYFDVKFLCDYYILNDCTAGVDQRVKNMMFAFWYDPDYSGKGDGMLCYPIYYDCDTILGVRNDGRLVYNWDIDENSPGDPSNPDDGTYAFAGHDSVLWKNLRDLCQTELSESYIRLRNSNMTNEFMYESFDNNQSDKYCEKIFNKDSIYKYSEPLTQGVEVIVDGQTTNTKYNYIELLQGTRKAHRHWFISNRMDLFDAKYIAGNYKVNRISWKGAASHSVYGDFIVRATAYRNYYFSIEAENLTQQHSLVKTDEEWVYTRKDDTAIGTAYSLYGCNWMKKLDLSDWNGFSEINIMRMPVLEEFKLGNNRFDNAGVKAVEVSSNFPLVKKITVNRFTGLPSLNVSGCLYLEELDLRGCTSLTTVSFAEGGKISKVYLPVNFQNLVLVGLPDITINNIVFDNIKSVQLLRVENCKEINGMDMFYKIFRTEDNNLKYVRITGLDLSGNGDDLREIYNAKLGGITAEGNSDGSHCRLVGTYKLTRLLEDNEYKTLSEYFNELTIVQPTFTTIKFNNRQDTPEKITNLDNQTGFDYENTYEPSGFLTKILDKRHSYLVKKDPTGGAGVFAACQLDDNNSNLYSDGNVSKVDGSHGDLCMYEPHYWYKGVNDHKNGIIYAMFSSLDSVPTVSTGLKVKKSDCVITQGYAINATDLYSTVDSAKVSNPSYNIYRYTLPDDNDYKQYRVLGVASDSLGAVVSDKDGRILQKLKANSNLGMFSGSYLFNNLPSNAKDIYFTVIADDTYNNADYCLYLTESSEIESIEPDWVEHKECFIGKIISAPYNESINSALLLTANNRYYPTEGSGKTMRELSSMLKGKGTGYYPFDYESYKDILMLSYAKYGTTNLHGSKVGTGRDSTGGYSRIKVSYYLPNSVDYTEYGVKDTNTDSDYVSYYKSNDIDRIYPGVSTLMGYHQFIGQCSVVSDSDLVNRLTDVYSNERTGRKAKLFANNTYRNSLNVQGGRYLDIFGVGETSTGAETTGYCNSEMKEKSTSANSGYLVLGYSGAEGYTNVTSCIKISVSTITSVITNYSISNLLRVLIVPTSTNFIKDSNTYISL